MREPIVKSFLETDFYKLTMGQFVLHNYPNVDVTFGFKCRTAGAQLANHIPENALRAELDHVLTLRPSVQELEYLAGLKTAGGTRLFQNDFLYSLSCIKLPKYQLGRTGEDSYNLTFTGKWPEVIYWETYALPIISQLYYEHMLDTNGVVAAYREGNRRLREKITVFKKHPEIRFIDFGLRRAFSKRWHENVVRTLKQELTPEQFVGSSTVNLAMKYGLKPTGTMAHELFMVFAALLDAEGGDITLVQDKVLDEWWDEYGEELSVALTDTFTSDFFFRTMTPAQARKWRGLRQDSGDPLTFAQKTLEFYFQLLGINPHSKIIVFSDSLDVNKMVQIANYCEGKIGHLYGVGTNLSNDLGIPPLSIVIKAIGANGTGTVKLSDNLAKATGSHVNIQRYMREFQTGEISREEVRY